LIIQLVVGLVRSTSNHCEVNCWSCGQLIAAEIYYLGCEVITSF